MESGGTARRFCDATVRYHGLTLSNCYILVLVTAAGRLLSPIANATSRGTFQPSSITAAIARSVPIIRSGFTSRNQSHTRSRFCSSAGGEVSACSDRPGGNRSRTKETGDSTPWSVCWSYVGRLAVVPQPDTHLGKRAVFLQPCDGRTSAEWPRRSGRPLVKVCRRKWWYSVTGDRQDRCSPKNIGQ